MNADRATARYLTFRIEAALYALPASEVTEVIRLPAMARVPQGPPALLGVGYIVGLNIATLIFMGGALNWWIAIPLLASIQGIPAGAPDAASAAGAIWSAQTRYIGVGAMIMGGMWTLVQVRTSVTSGVRSGLEAYRKAKRGETREVPRTERDTPTPWVGWAVMFAIIPLFFVFRYITGSSGVSLLMAVVMLIAGFLFSAVAGYMAGLVGSSNNPISGVTIATIVTTGPWLLRQLTDLFERLMADVPTLIG